jgi:hypothetical protein
MAKRKKKNKRGLLIIVVLIIIVVCGVFVFLNKDKFGKTVEKVKETLPVSNVKTVEIVDVNSDSRPIAVMINNHPSARKVHTGLQDAYIIYEIIVEGGFTRYMALYKDNLPQKIGSIRSSRHYFLDYALENDAIYVHWGWSPKAQTDISKLKINNINGLTYEGIYFYREENLGVDYEHRGFSTDEMLNNAISKLKYEDTTKKDLLLNYSVDEVDLSKMEGSKVANKVNITYSNSTETNYVYDSDNKVYLRYVNNVEHKDYATKEQYTVKNIITYQVSNHTLSGDVKGRQDIDNIGSGSGYYISNGYAVPIKWSKKSRSAQTIYTYEDGTEINVNDGNTYIQIQPKSKVLTFE